MVRTPRLGDFPKVYCRNYITTQINTWLIYLGGIFRTQIHIVIFIIINILKYFISI